MKKRYFFPALFLGLLMIIGASLPRKNLDRIQESSILLGIIFSDFSLHFFAFAIFTACLTHGFYRLRNRNIPYFLIGLIALSFALFIEFYQIFIPSRGSSLFDLIPGVSGTIFALIMFKIFISPRFEHNEKHNF